MGFVELSRHTGLSVAMLSKVERDKLVEWKLNAYHAEFQTLPPGKARLHQHPGIEFLSSLRGKPEMQVGAEEHTLYSGDSIYFDASLPHSYRRVSRKPCSAIVVTAPS